MRTLAMLIVCLAAFGLAACTESAPRVGVVDAEIVLSECQAGKDGMDYLRSLSEELGEKLKKLDAELDENAAQDKLEAYQQVLAQARMQLNTEQGRIMGLIQTGFDEAVEEYRAKNKLDVVLLREQTLAISPAVDGTKAVLALLDAKKIVVAPAAPEVPAAPEAPAETPAVPAPGETPAPPAQ
ncbi:outer membrane chaperone Skp (OmpH) [Alkalidesulfovibrio alkalitolerans DSM 16529]|jgi:Skp family chaperone for outer membrane proteins|uniref:Outer membrane chaperone Skp (OmpH) n=1 Tax=Alkalidesulfovibrio alkalitolerans DSM 16529 TaxID=1121439 RepID=S7THY3_9BACT|nr:OmpH family outer membrane protein [Alkalidesulfovibrio alkalitolerans]EPR36235.1 outer membrane chaperone Skp (OmpH) [Alkalidesulfovibrio alkalitolerans DSM 16529]